MNKIIWADMEYMYKERKWDILKNSNILITGAYGMIASYAVWMMIYLNERHSYNITIYALGRNENKMQERFGEYYNKPYMEFINSDLSHNFEHAHFDFIIHSASHASSQFFGVDPVGTILPNVIGTYNLLNGLINDIPKSVLFVSSGEVYGKTNVDFVKEDYYGVSDPLDIRYSYGESKRMGESICKAFCVQYGMPVKIVRLGHTYGPTMDLDNDKRVFSEFVSNIVKNKNIEIKSDGLPVRAFCYLVDAILGFFDVLFDGVDGEAYNIANRNGLISIRELAEKLVSLYPEKHLNYTYVERPKNDTYIESNQAKHNVPDTSKLEALGWKCNFDIENGFKRTIDSFLEN